MSHIAEVYAKDLGVKIGKPIIADHFYPGLPEKYITFQASNKMPAKNYNHWDLVIGLIAPHLQGMKIVQVGGPKDPQVNGVDLFIPSSYRQMNYIIKNGQAHFGVDSLPMHVASVYDRPIVALFSNLYKNNAHPLWNKKTKAICLEPDFSGNKPSFGPNCDRINEIKPEEISQAILDQLGIQEKIKFKTIRIGSNFHKQVVEIIPNFSSLAAELQGKLINVRGDLYWDLENIVRWCRFSFVNLIISSSFSLNHLKQMKNLKQVIYKYDENENEDLTDFFKALKKHKINVIIQLKDNSRISDVRLKYFDFNVISEPEPHKEISAGKYLSSKRVVSEAQTFNSESAYIRLDKSNNFVYDEASSKELESLYLYDEE